MIQLEDITVGAVHGLSLDVGAGQSCRLTVLSQDTQRDLLALLAGHAPPTRGRMRFWGQDVYALPDAARTTLYRRVGIVPEQGGLISNLKAWENILLPAWYHQRLDAAGAEPRVVALWRELGGATDDLRDLMAKLPDRLSVLERRFVALARALLPQPELLVYDFTIAGLDAGVAGRLRELMQRFHGERPGRISVYLCPDEPASEKIHADVTRRVG